MEYHHRCFIPRVDISLGLITLSSYIKVSTRVASTGLGKGEERRVVPIDVGLFMSVIVWSTYALPVHVLFCGN